MQLVNILQLNNDLESLNVIQDFFERPISQHDFEAALNKYLKIATVNELNELIISEGIKLLDKTINLKPTKYRENIYSLIFEAALILKNYELAERYLNLRKEVLPQLETYLSLIDKYRLNKAIGFEVYDNLIELKREAIPLDVKVYLNEELLEYYFANNKYDEAIQIIIELKEDTLNNKYDYLLIKTYYHHQMYDLVISNAKKLILENKIDLYSIVYYIASLREIGEYQRAVNLEVEYEIAFENSNDLELKILAYQEIIKLYEKHYNKPSVTEYKQKLSKVNRLVKKEEVSEKVLVKQEIKEIKTSKLVSHAKYLEHFDLINKWLIFSANLAINLSFREYLRTLFIEINKEINLRDAIIYLNFEEDSNLFNYKKNRLYDKRIIKHSLEETIFYQMISEKSNIFGEPKSLVTRKDILTNTNFNEAIKYVYGFYINDDFLISFYLDEELSDPAIYYELFLGIKTIIELRVLSLNSQKSLIKNDKYLFNLINNPIMPIRILTNNNISYNEKAMALFKIDRKHLLELFVRDLSLSDAKMYEETIKRLFNYPNETKIIKYQYQDLVIVEYLYAYKEVDEIKIISFFVDVTKDFKSEELLLEQVKFDAETKLLSLNAFDNEFNNYIKSKTTLMLVELNTNLKDIYGVNRANKFFVEFTSHNLKHFTNYPVYRYDFNKILIVLNVNDIRAVSNIVSEYLMVVNHLESHLLKYESFKVNIATLRYPVVTTDTNINNIFKYLDLTLIKAKLEKKEHLDFTYSLYEEDIFEQQVIDYLNEAIQNRSLKLNFQQIINLEKNIVDEYESHLVLPTINIDSSYLKKIARRRGKLEDLEYFHIELILSFLRKLEDETNHLINVTIPISNETFRKPDFDSYLIQVLKKYQISAKVIKLMIYGQLTSQSDILKAHNLIKYGINLNTDKVSVALSADFSAVHLPLNISTKKWRSYVKDINKILEELNIKLVIRDIKSTQERNEIKALGINYISGSIYKSVEPESIIKQIKDKL